tara:strand:+ start:3569 stop:3865 length:297 start_codon:yes stop_codon:yes gene_type:complete
LGGLCRALQGTRSSKCAAASDNAAAGPIENGNFWIENGNFWFDFCEFENWTANTVLLLLEFKVDQHHLSNPTMEINRRSGRSKTLDQLDQLHATSEDP